MSAASSMIRPWIPRWAGLRFVVFCSWMTVVGCLPVACCVAEDEAAAFEPGDISIGEPIPLPFAPASTPPAAAAGETALESLPKRPAAAGLTPIRDRTAPLGSPSPAPDLGSVAETPPAALPTRAAGQGWLGLSVGESATAGRWIVDTVAPVGPAAAAGILPGDEVRGINGLPLRNADEVAQALIAIAPGQAVRMAIARGEQVRDLQLTAAVRPQAASPAPASPAAASPFVAAPPLTQPLAAGNDAAAGFAISAPSSAAAPAAFPPNGISAPAVNQPSAAADSRALAGSSPPARPVEQAGGRTALGVRTVPIDADLQSRFRLPAASGAYVIGVVQDLPASKAGVPPGSVIVSLDDRPVRSPAELTQLVTRGPVGRPLTLEYVLPGGASQRADVVLQTLEKPLEAALVGQTEPTATSVPILQSGPPTTIARRPAPPLDAGAAAAIRDEIRWLRARLSELEQRLQTGLR